MWKRRGLIACLFSICALGMLKAQPESVHYSLSYGAGVGYRILLDEQGVRLGNTGNNYPLVVHQVHLQADIPLNRRLGLISGIGFQSFGDQIKANFHSLSFPDGIDPHYGFVYQTREDYGDFTSKFQYTYNYLVVPLWLRWSMRKQKHSSLGLMGGIGGGVHLYSSQRMVKVFEDGFKEVSKHEYVAPLRDLILTGSVGVSYKFDVNNKFFVAVGPHFDFVLTDIYTGTPRSRYPYSAVLKLSVGWKT